MAYLHEATLKEAQKKLYMLGSSDRKHDKTSFDEAGGALTSIAGGMKESQDKKLKTAQEASRKLAEKQKAALDQRDAEMVAEDKWQPIQEGYRDKVSPEVGQNMMAGFTGGQRMPIDQDGPVEAYSRPQPLVQDPNNVINRVNSNEDAANTRMGGVYTPQGLQTASRTADANANDLLYSNALMGIGGSMRRF